MDPTAVDPALVDLLVKALVQSVPDAGFWAALLGVGTVAWRSAAGHLCEFVAKALVIAEKLADKGIDVRLTVTNIDGDKVREVPSGG
jgi:hypothetical protein